MGRVRDNPDYKKDAEALGVSLLAYLKVFYSRKANGYTYFKYILSIIGHLSVIYRSFIIYNESSGVSFLFLFNNNFKLPMELRPRPPGKEYRGLTRVAVRKWIKDPADRMIVPPHIARMSPQEYARGFNLSVEHRAAVKNSTDRPEVLPDSFIEPEIYTIRRSSNRERSLQRQSNMDPPFVVGQDQTAVGQKQSTVSNAVGQKQSIVSSPLLPIQTADNVTVKSEENFKKNSKEITLF